MNWVGEPVLLYGHSAGAAGSVIVAHRNPGRIRLLFLEGCYARTREALLGLYYHYNPIFGILFGPFIIFWMEVFYRGRLDKVSPVKLAPEIDLPVLLIHGEKDQSFPLHHLRRLSESFPPGRAEIFIAKGADHSSSSLSPEYPPSIRNFVHRHLPPKER
jgi:pimeloyl-ACP methyl ester carboxylesterase